MRAIRSMLFETEGDSQSGKDITWVHYPLQAAHENAHTAKTSHYKILLAALLTFYISVAVWVGGVAPPEEPRPVPISVYTVLSMFFISL